ncbi:hypothetical protein ANTPLA_LOCUS10573 [Anthophora plagiata]
MVYRFDITPCSLLKQLSRVLRSCSDFGLELRDWLVETTDLSYDSNVNGVLQHVSCGAGLELSAIKYLAGVLNKT